MKNVKLAAFALAGAILLSLSGCLPASGSTAVSHRVTLVAKSTSTEFWKSVFAGANAASAEYNIALTIVGPDSEEDYQTQNEMIRRAVSGGTEALVFSAIAYEENAPAIDEAGKRGLPVVSIDSDVDSTYVSVRIGTDNVDAGRKAAFAALDNDDEQLIVGLVNYNLGSRNGQEREQGFREVCRTDSRVAGIYAINVLATEDDAQEKTLALLQQHPEINAVVGFNEPTSVGAALAIHELGLGGQVHMVGFDSNVHTIDLMQQGDVTALIVQNPYAMGYLGVEAAYKLLSGQSYDATALWDTSTTTVTRDNMFAIENQKAMFSFG